MPGLVQLRPRRCQQGSRAFVALVQALGSPFTSFTEVAIGRAGGNKKIISSMQRCQRIQAMREKEVRLSAVFDSAL